MVRQPLVLVLFWCCIAASARGASAQGMDRHPLLPGGEVVRTGEHYELHAHFNGPEEADLALEIVEAAWPVTMRMLGTKDANIAWPLEVHLYGTKTDYAVVEKGLTKGQFRDNESFAHWNTRTAHLAMAPPLIPPADETVLLSNQTREILSHEAAHLAVYSVISTYRWHPTWFGEGLAILVEMEVARQRGFLEDPAAHPRFSTDQLLARRLLEEGRLPSVEAIITDSLEGISSQERYALWLEFMKVLSAREHAQRFRALIIEMRSARGGPGMRPNIADFVRRTYGVARLERELRARIGALRPQWEELYRSLETIGDEWFQAAFPGRDAIAWRTEPVGRSRYSLVGHAVLTSRLSRMDVHLGRSATGHLAISFDGSGRLVVVRTSGPSGPSDLGGTAETIELAALRADIEPERELAFRIDVSQGGLDVTIDGDRSIEELPLEGMALDGAFGLGVRQSGSGLWRDVRIVE